MNQTLHGTHLCNLNQFTKTTKRKLIGTFHAVYAESTVVKSNRVDVRIVHKERKEVLHMEMTCPWIGNRGKEGAEKTTKYATLRWEMKERYPGYVVKQINIIVDVLGGYALEARNKMKELYGEKRAIECLMKMQKSILSSTLNIARCFKVMSEK